MGWATCYLKFSELAWLVRIPWKQFMEQWRHTPVSKIKCCQTEARNYVSISLVQQVLNAIEVSLWLLECVDHPMRSICCGSTKSWTVLVWKEKQRRLLGHNHCWSTIILSGPCFFWQAVVTWRFLGHDVFKLDCHTLIGYSHFFKTFIHKPLRSWIQVWESAAQVAKAFAIGRNEAAAYMNLSTRVSPAMVNRLRDVVRIRGMRAFINHEVIGRELFNRAFSSGTGVLDAWSGQLMNREDDELVSWCSMWPSKSLMMCAIFWGLSTNLLSMMLSLHILGGLPTNHWWIYCWKVAGVQDPICLPWLDI